MWKLIIHQIKKYDTWESDQEIVFKSDNMDDLLPIIKNLALLYTNTDTWYEVREAKDGEEYGI